MCEWESRSLMKCFMHWINDLQSKRHTNYVYQRDSPDRGREAWLLFPYQYHPWSLVWYMDAWSKDCISEPHMQVDIIINSSKSETKRKKNMYERLLLVNSKSLKIWEDCSFASVDSLTFPYFRNLQWPQVKAIFCMWWFPLFINCNWGRR